MALTNKFYKDYYNNYNQKRTGRSSLKEFDTHILHGLVVGSKSKTVLDYGSGEGNQYFKEKAHEKFKIDIDNVTCYDIGVPEFSKLPKGKFDGVISTDVLEHIPEEFLDENIKKIYSKAKKFVYLGVHCGLAIQKLPNGENAHCSIFRPSEWKERIDDLNTNNIPTIVTYRIPIDPDQDILGLNRQK